MSNPDNWLESMPSKKWTYHRTTTSGFERLTIISTGQRMRIYELDESSLDVEIIGDHNVKVTGKVFDVHNDTI
jgi:hypothetical protein